MTAEEIEELEPDVTLVWDRGARGKVLVEFGGWNMHDHRDPTERPKWFVRTPVGSKYVDAKHLRLPTANDLLVLEGPP